MVVRLKDIAAELGVSVVTVSRALRNRPDIAEETKAKILERVKRLNYRPNLTARSLVTGRSSLIGLVVPDLIHPFFGEIAKGLSNKLQEKEYYLIVCSSESDPQLEQNEVEHMLAHHLDCFVVASCRKDTDSLRRISEAGVPLVLVDRSFPGFPLQFCRRQRCKGGRARYRAPHRAGLQAHCAHSRPGNQRGQQSRRGILATRSRATA